MAFFFSFEFLPNFSEGFLVSKNNYQKEIDKRTKALNKVKEYAKGTKVYDEYIVAKKSVSNAKKEYYEYKKEEAVFGFRSFQLFMAEFGKFFCFFVYAMFNLFRSFYFERKNVGMKVLHGLILAGTIFYFFWIFQVSQDFSKPVYYFATLISAAVVVHAVLLITKYQDHYINRLKKKYLKIAKFTFLNTKPEKKEEMLEVLEDLEKVK